MLRRDRHVLRVLFAALKKVVAADSALRRPPLIEGGLIILVAGDALRGFLVDAFVDGQGGCAGAHGAGGGDDDSSDGDEQSVGLCFAGS